MEIIHNLMKLWLLLQKLIKIIDILHFHLDNQLQINEMCNRYDIYLKQINFMSFPPFILDCAACVDDVNSEFRRMYYESPITFFRIPNYNFWEILIFLFSQSRYSKLLKKHKQNDYKPTQHKYICSQLSESDNKCNNCIIPIIVNQPKFQP